MWRGSTSDGKEVVKKITVAGVMTIANLADVNAAVAQPSPGSGTTTTPNKLAVTGRSTRGSVLLGVLAIAVGSAAVAAS
jgi:hypothetical protein